jgi:hypothetical protein
VGAGVGGLGDFGDLARCRFGDLDDEGGVVRGNGVRGSWIGRGLCVEVGGGGFRAFGQKNGGLCAKMGVWSAVGGRETN